MTSTKDSRTPAAPCILVVDDEPDILLGLKSLIEHSLEGARVLTAQSGREGLKVMDKERVSLVLSDYKMPGMTGIEFLVACRKARPETPRVLITAFPDLDVAIRAINDGGISKFITKPFNPTALVDAIRWTILEHTAPGAVRP